MNVNIKNYNQKMPMHADHYHNKHYDDDIKSGHIKKVKSTQCLHKGQNLPKQEPKPVETQKKPFLEPGVPCQSFEEVLSTTSVNDNGLTTYLMAKALSGPALHFASQVCNQKQPAKKPSKKIPELPKSISGDLGSHLHGYSTITHEGIYRKSNEDKITIYLEEDYKWFSIYDGHGGSTCAQYLKEHLHEEFFALDWRKDIPNALRQAFINAEAGWKNKGDNSGSCAIVIFIYENVCYAANLGDSRAVLGSQGGNKCYQITKDHKPSNPAEQTRIMEAGGKIYQTTAITQIEGKYDMIVGPLRVFPGRLSTTRTFGDFEAKDVKVEGNQKVVICEPEITSFEIYEHDFIVIGSDGLWDRVENTQIVEIMKGIHEKGARGQEWLGASSEIMLQEAMNRGSTDNVSLIIVGINDLLAEKEPKKGNEHIKIMGSVNSNILRKKVINNKENSYPEKIKEIDSRISEINRNASRILQSKR